MYSAANRTRRWVIFPPTQKIQKGILSEAVPYFRVLAHQQKTRQWNGKLSCENIPEKVEAGEGRVRPDLVNIDLVNIEAEAEAEGVN